MERAAFAISTSWFHNVLVDSATMKTNAAEANPKTRSRKTVVPPSSIRLLAKGRTTIAVTAAGMKAITKQAQTGNA